MKIAFLGDSLTWGGYGGNFVDEVRDRLPDHEIINAGEGGDTVVNLLSRLDDVLADEPDGVFILIGGNDAISHSQPGARGYYRWKNAAPPDGHMTVDQFTKAFRDLLTQLQLQHVQVWVALPMIEYNPTVVEAVQQFNNHMRMIAGSFNIDVLDLMAHFPPQNIKDRPPLDQQYILTIRERGESGWNDFEAERKREGYTWSFDGLHLTPASAKRLAQIIVEFLDL
jgi:lysophospholipase L1-like esterase